jgi:hypothetical protein
MGSDEEIQMLAETYEAWDVGELYDHSHNASAEELMAIKIAGINLGHIGVVERVYNEINQRILRKAGATDDEITDFNRACLGGGINGNPESSLETVVKLAEQYKVEFRGPSPKELLFTLLHSAQERGASIEDVNSSTGTCYQMLFGQDYQHVVFHVQEPSGEKVIPYEKVDPDQRGHALIQHHLREAGILRPKPNNPFRIEFLDSGQEGPQISPKLQELLERAQASENSPESQTEE